MWAAMADIALSSEGELAIAILRGPGFVTGTGKPTRRLRSQDDQGVSLGLNIIGMDLQPYEGPKERRKQGQ